MDLDHNAVSVPLEYSDGGKHPRLLRLQSAHTLLGSNFRRLLIVCWFCAARSAAGFGGRRDMAGGAVGRSIVPSAVVRGGDHVVRRKHWVALIRRGTGGGAFRHSVASPAAKRAIPQKPHHNRSASIPAGFWILTFLPSSWVSSTFIIRNAVIQLRREQLVDQGTVFSASYVTGNGY